MVQVAPLRPGTESRENQRRLQNNPGRGGGGARSLWRRPGGRTQVSGLNLSFVYGAHSKIGERDGRREGYDSGFHIKCRKGAGKVRSRKSHTGL